MDVEGLSLSQVTYYTPSLAKMIVEFVQKSLSMRLKSIHVVNQSFLFNMVFAIFKPFLEVCFYGYNYIYRIIYIELTVLTYN